ncbi:MAG: hypothetical protein H3Z54_09605 [archaeon]|nr:hypothetical protein [archaeon]
MSISEKEKARLDAWLNAFIDAYRRYYARIIKKGDEIIPELNLAPPVQAMVVKDPKYDMWGLVLYRDESKADKTFEYESCEINLDESLSWIAWLISGEFLHVIIWVPAREVFKSPFIPDEQRRKEYVAMVGRKYSSIYVNPFTNPFTNPSTDPIDFASGLIDEERFDVAYRHSLIKDSTMNIEKTLSQISSLATSQQLEDAVSQIKNETTKIFKQLDELKNTLKTPAIYINQLSLAGRDISGTIIQAEKSQVSIGDIKTPLIKAIDEKPDIDDYEKDFLKQRITELQNALNERNKSRFDGIKGWLKTHAPWLVPKFDKPDVQEVVKKAFGS